MWTSVSPCLGCADGHLDRGGDADGGVAEGSHCGGGLLRRGDRGTGERTIEWTAWGVKTVEGFVVLALAAVSVR
jgi:hypothetical protein